MQRGRQLLERAVALAQGDRQLAQAFGELGLLRADRRERRVRVFDEVGDGFVAGADRRDRLRRFHEEVRERLLVARELVEEVAARAQERREVFDRAAERAAGAGVLFGGSLDELAQAEPRLGVERVEQLVEVDHFFGRARGQGRAVVQRGRVVGPGRQQDVAVGDARERGHAHLRGRAGVQRRERGVDVDRHARLEVLRQHDVGDAADGNAADLNLVAADELAGFGEDQLVVGAEPRPKSR